MKERTHVGYVHDHIILYLNIGHSKAFLLANEWSFFLPSGGLGSGGVLNIWPVRPFETVSVITGYTNTIELH